MHWLLDRVLFFQFLQLLSQAVMDLRRFHQLLPRNATFFRRIGFDETAIDRQMRPSNPCRSAEAGGFQELASRRK
jgi:hypothetical protein